MKLLCLLFALLVVAHCKTTVGANNDEQMLADAPQDDGRLPIIGVAKTMAQLSEAETVIVHKKMQLVAEACPRGSCPGIEPACQGCMAGCVRKRFPDAHRALLQCAFSNHIDVCDSGWTCAEQCIDTHHGHPAEERNACMTACCDELSWCQQQRCALIIPCLELDTVAPSHRTCAEEDCQSACPVE